MLKIGRWFSFSTPEERDDYEQDYFRSVFPFGEPQKQLEQALLKVCVHAPVNENEKLYQLLVLKNLYSQSKPLALEDDLIKWYRGRLLRKWPDSARAAVLSLAQLSLQAKSLEMLPGEECVLANAAEIEKELLPRLKGNGKR